MNWRIKKRPALVMFKYVVESQKDEYSMWWAQSVCLTYWGARFSLWRRSRKVHKPDRVLFEKRVG